MKESLVFLGHQVSPAGLKPPCARVTVILDLPKSFDSAGLRRCLWLIGFYRRMIPRFPDIVFHPTELVRLHPRSNELSWTDQQTSAFSYSKVALASACTLPHPLPQCHEYELVTDASQVAVGATLHQLVDGESVPVGFFSQTLSQPLQWYAAYDRELLAAYLATLHFLDAIKCREVTILTDHKPLVSAFRSPHIAKSERRHRHWFIITDYVSDVRYICGGDNVVADCLSRPTYAANLNSCDLHFIAQYQDEEASRLREVVEAVPLSDSTVLCHVSGPQPRPFVPGA